MSAAQEDDFRPLSDAEHELLSALVSVDFAGHTLSLRNWRTYLGGESTQKEALRYQFQAQLPLRSSTVCRWRG
jgi:hypothetical protein